MTQETPPPVRVLIVEDEVIIAMEIQLRLENAGFEVCGIAATGEGLPIARPSARDRASSPSGLARLPTSGLVSATAIRACARACASG